MFICPKTCAQELPLLINVNPTISTWLAVPDAVPPDHLIVDAVPPICKACGIYGVGPWFNIMVVVMALLLSVGILIKLAV